MVLEAPSPLLLLLHNTAHRGIRDDFDGFGGFSHHLGGPTVAYLWPTTSEPSQKVSENRKFMDLNISVICAGICCVTEIHIHIYRMTYP